MSDQGKANYEAYRKHAGRPGVSAHPLPEYEHLPMELASAYALAPGELAALAQQDGAPAGLTDDEAYEWYRARPPQVIDLVMAALSKALEDE